MRSDDLPDLLIGRAFAFLIVCAGILMLSIAFVAIYATLRLP